MAVGETPNPFVGPRPISKAERIFGRDQEIRNLTHLLLAKRIVVLYSPPGAGKSSLIHAGFIQAFGEATENEFCILPTIRLSIVAGTAAPGPSLLSDAVIRSVERPGIDSVDSTKFGSLEQYFNVRVKENTQGKCVCMVFDQFEECITVLPGENIEKKAFFLDLGRTLADANVWALFAVREEFLGPIIDLGQVLPTRLKETFRLDFLSRAAAREVIRKTLDIGAYEFAPAVLEELVDNLATVYVQEPDGTFGARLGEYIEPLHLQVACRHLLQGLPEGTRKVEGHHLQRSMRGIGYASVDEALAAYYRNAVSEIAGVNRALERDIRFWIQQNLIDPRGIRIAILQDANSTEGLDNKAIDRLYNVYLVRKERRLNATWYELAHDRFVQPILLDNKEWFDKNLSFLDERCREWNRSGRHPGRLLSAHELKRVIKENLSTSRTLSADEIEFVRQSRQRHRRDILRSLIVIGLVLALAVALAALAAVSYELQSLRRSQVHTSP